MATFDDVRAVVVEQLSVDEDTVKMESKIIEDLGADSLDVVELVMALEEKFDEELFQLVIENIIVYPDKRLGFRMKNGLELEEFYGEEVDKCKNIRQ